MLITPKNYFLDHFGRGFFCLAAAQLFSPPPIFDQKYAISELVIK